MIEFLVIFSLILHAIVFIFIIYLYRRFSQNSSGMSVQERKEMEDMLSSYITEMKEENERLLNILNENGKNVKEKQTEPDSRENSSPIPDTYVEPVQKKDTTAKETKNAENYNPETIVVEDEAEGVSDHAKALQLYNDGLTTEEIAQKLNKGKTEIELFIKFQSQS
ncbi:hypothetical protein GWK91_04620 [Virgibacillus sp. MSP4-1]|uniref:DUF6115 domain-containing protein n=1 Tax=Virgibacillus sp. MSP4-1 TaxID=2700081 RepID=UPI00039BBC7F|nr:hypothetical protein [Virgibacillus sp. MSP4-1]QHS22273.1 hypothetical protein GWK91_04620 [Virgibacillus sp. MSP4-1]